MSVKYALHPNPLTDDPNDCRAMVNHSGSYSTPDLIEVMTRGGSTITRGEALAVIEEYESALCTLLEEGGRINTPMFRFSFSVSGRFEGRDDYFDADRHTLKLNVSAGSRARALPEGLSPKKVASSRRYPALQRYTDISTGTRNQQITPGGAGIIRGQHLKVNVSDPEQGLFVRGSDGTETRVEHYIRNKPSELIVTLPDSLPPGPCQLEVRATLHRTTDIRTGLLDEDLQIAG